MKKMQKYINIFFLPCTFSSKLLVFPSLGNSSRTDAISLSGPLAGLLGLDLGPIVVGLSIDALGCVVVAIFDFVKITELIKHDLKKKSRNEIVMFEIKETKEQIYQQIYGNSRKNQD